MFWQALSSSNRFQTAVSYYLAKVMFTLQPILYTPQITQIFHSLRLYKYLQLIFCLFIYFFFCGVHCIVLKYQIEFRPYFFISHTHKLIKMCVIVLYKYKFQPIMIIMSVIFRVCYVVIIIISYDCNTEFFGE